MSLATLKTTAGVLAGTFLLILVGPVAGELAVTLPPAFPRDSVDLLTKLDVFYEDVGFSTFDGLTLRGWFFPTDLPDAPAIIYVPATAHDQRSGLSLVPVFHKAGYHVLLFSYRGHALSEGHSWNFTYGDVESQDVEAAVRFLHETKGIRRIGVIGHSVGAVSAILSAARNPRVGAVVAVAAFNCVDEVWRTIRPPLIPPFFMNLALRLAEARKGFDRDDVCPLKVVHQIAPRPLLLLHGKEDQNITEGQVQRLFAAAQEPKALWLVAGASHRSIRDPVLDGLAPDVIDFLNAALRGEDEQKPELAHRVE